VEVHKVQSGEIDQVACALLLLEMSPAVFDHGHPSEQTSLLTLLSVV